MALVPGRVQRRLAWREFQCIAAVAAGQERGRPNRPLQLSYSQGGCRGLAVGSQDCQVDIVVVLAIGLLLKSVLSSPVAVRSDQLEELEWKHHRR